MNVSVENLYVDIGVQMVNEIIRIVLISSSGEKRLLSSIATTSTNWDWNKSQLSLNGHLLMPGNYLERALSSPLAPPKLGSI